MCDDKTHNDNLEYLRKKSGLTRREFSQMSAAAILMAVLPKVANARAVVENDVVIDTPDGKADCYFVHPEDAAAPAVLIWPDILGLRPAFRQMGKRLAESGYAVLVVNPFYRDEKSPVVGPGASFSDAAVRTKVIGLAVSHASLDSATSHPGGKTEIVMLAAGMVGLLMKGGTAELRCPDNEGALQHAGRSVLPRTAGNAGRQ